MNIPMNLADQMAESIIKEHAKIIGAIAWEEAAKVIGLQIDPKNHIVHITGQTASVLKELVRRFEYLFGFTARQVSQTAIESLISAETEVDLPNILKK